MRVTRQIFNEAEFLRIIRGSVLQDLQRRGEKVVDQAQQNVSRQFPPVGDFPFPARRTGDLLNSIHQETLMVEGFPRVMIVADAIHRGWEYPQTLRERGWKFITEQQLEQAIKEE